MRIKSTDGPYSKIRLQAFSYPCPCLFYPGGLSLIGESRVMCRVTDSRKPQRQILMLLISSQRALVADHLCLHRIGDYMRPHSL